MSTPVTVASYSSLRGNTWATDLVELESTLTVLVAGIWHILDAVREAAPLVAPTSPSIDNSDPDYAWDRETTPGRLYSFLVALATDCPHITPSAYIETFELVRSMLVFVWEHPVIVRKVVCELELFFMRTFWNVATRYDKTFTEDLFNELTEHRYVRRLEQSTSIILQRTMNLEDSKRAWPHQTSWRKELCNSYADYVVDVETKHPYVDPSAVDQGVVTFGDRSESVERLPSRLEVPTNAGFAPEEAPRTDIDPNEELEVEVDNLSTSDSNCAMYGTPDPTAYVYHYTGTIPDIVVSSPTEAGSTCDEFFDALDSMTPELDSAGEAASQDYLNPVEGLGVDALESVSPELDSLPGENTSQDCLNLVEGLEMDDPLSIHLPLSGITVRSRPLFGPLRAPGSEAGSDVDTVEPSAPLGPWTSEEILVLENCAYLFSPEVDNEEEEEEEEEEEVPSSSSFGRFFRGSVFGSSNKGTWKSTSSSPINASSSSDSSVPTRSSRHTNSSRSKELPTPPLSKRLGSSFRAFLRRRGIIRRKLTPLDRATCKEFWRLAADGPPMIGRNGLPVSVEATHYMKEYMPSYYWHLRRAAYEKAPQKCDDFERRRAAFERNLEHRGRERRFVPSIVSGIWVSFTRF